MLTGNAAFVREHPVVTKRVLRAILKAADLCVSEPALIARRIVNGGFTDNYDFVLETLRTIPYDKWREYDAEDGTPRNSIAARSPLIAATRVACLSAKMPVKPSRLGSPRR
jgi:ABC-type nitrate/sulfonate/bicarbonate transport system substrate-binding protein